jgi:pyochelin synthetase
LDAELRSFLQSHVPAHLIPSHISIVDELPQTATGKIDRDFMRRQFHER